MRVFAAGLIAVFLSACTGGTFNVAEPGEHLLSRTDGLGECARAFEAADEAVLREATGDAQHQRVAGFAYLRINRLLAAYEVDPSNSAQFDAWVEALSALDENSRSFELSNLPETVADEIDQQRLNECRRQLLAYDMSSPETRLQLIQQARSADAYSGAKRVLGLYPLTSIAMRFGVSRLNEETARRFNVPLADLPIEGRLTRFETSDSTGSLTPSEVAGILFTATQNPLAMPLPDETQLARLFAAFAPVWEVDVAGEADLIGRPTPAGGELGVDASVPTVYTLASHTRFGDQYLLQLNYVVWFAARPAQSPFDLLAGELDGVTWRVTLGANGEPLFYDAMHNCGCYYMAFPSPRLESIDTQVGFEEPLMVPQRVGAGEGRLVIRLESGSHYLSRVYRDDVDPTLDSVELTLANYDELRSLPAENGRQSLFANDGIVVGSERGERWLFWPMGIAEPGAMRQWGTHAIAFVGRRHFDDPDLIERHFQLREPD